MKAANMSTEPTDFVRVIETDPARLEKVVINNLTGPTYVIGTNASQVQVRGRFATGEPFAPGVEVKNEGRRVEISGESQRGWNSQSWTDEPREDDDDDDDEDEAEDLHNLRREFRQQARRERRFMRDFDPTQVGEFVGEVAQNLSRWFYRTDAELYVEVPWGVELEVKTVSGLIEVADIRGFCRLSSTSGLISLRNLTGGLSLKNMSGRVEAAELAGRVSVRNVSGKVDLWDCHMSSLDLSVTSSHVMVETDLGGSNEGDYRINTMSGHVALKLPDNAPVSVDCRTLSGKLSLPQTVRAADMRNRPGQSQARFELNGGGRRVSINTMSGHIELTLFGLAENRERQQPVAPWPASAVRPEQGVPPATPLPPVPPVPPTPRAGFVPPVPPSTDFAPPPHVPPLWPAPVAQADPEPARPVEATPPSEQPDKQTRQLEILEALEQGKISVEEGLARLSSLENS